MTDLTEDADLTKNILVLSRNNPTEAMRVAAGLTIFGHVIELVFMHRKLTESEAESEQGELLELCDIVPKTTVSSMQQFFQLIDSEGLARQVANADLVINL